MSTVRNKTGRKAGVVVETMAAPNPFCPNTKGVCCLLLLLNLGLILVTLGFVIVIQFFEPFFVWWVHCSKFRGKKSENVNFNIIFEMYFFLC